MRKLKMKQAVVAGILGAAMVMSMGCGQTAPAKEEAPAQEEAAEEAPAEEAAEEENAVEEAPAADVDMDLKVGLLGTSIKPVGVLVADALGYFEEEGVNVEFEKVSSMNDAFIAVSTGDLDAYFFSSTAPATFISQGTDTLRIIGGTVGEGSEIMAPIGTDIKLDGPESFKGLRIACQMPETGQMVLKNYLIENGLTIGADGEDADVTFIYVEDGNTAVNGVVKGEYDLCITNQSLGYYAADLGVEVINAVRDFVEVYPCCRQTAYSGTVENQPEALTAFEVAVLRGYEYYLLYEEETLDILEAYSGEDREFLRGQIYGTDTYTPVMRVSPDPDKKACVAFYEAMVNLGLVEVNADIDWNDYVVTDFYDAALAIMEEREPDTALWVDMRAYFDAHN
ncbi:MAG: ABC transporter substrate-binding protein [Lachnospiraceae bacterium]|nr:ABC transporter substrate-binding protein [Lachnospiraceae bacterium]